jgi:TolB-like protein/class 3 adenylate cyclase/Flp pilus assembly protein TadD
VASLQSGRKLTTILASDIVGYSRLTSANEELTVARLRTLRSDLIDPLISVHHGRIVKTTGDGVLLEFRSVVEAVRCAVAVQTGMVERNAGLPPERRIEIRIGIHLGDVIEESDGDLMGDGVNIAARLEGIAEPGGICLSNAAYEQVRGKLGEAFVDLGDKALKNIALPVRVFAVDWRGNASVVGRGEVSAPRFSIVVLPFANIGGEPEQEYFADGVTESLTTDLSRISGSFVSARNTAFTYKGKHFDVKQIGRELGVRYVLEGSVQRGSDRLRINVQLIDAATGNHLWAERFDKPIADLFDMQDEIVARLASQLGAQLIEAEARRAERAPLPDSMDLYFQGMAWVNKGLTLEYFARARGFFERALALDSGNIEALVGMACADAIRAGNFMTDDGDADFAKAEAALTRALSLAPQHATAHLYLGFVQIHTDRAAQGIAECQRALTLDRNLAGAHGFIGLAKLYLGRAEETESHVLEALRLSPRDHFANAWMTFAGAAKIRLGSDEEAVEWLRRAVEANRNIPIAHFHLAAALAQSGRIDEARSVVSAGLALNPTFTIRRFTSTARPSDPAVRAQGRRLIEGMRKAGLPNG